MPETIASVSSHPDDPALVWAGRYCWQSIAVNDPPAPVMVLEVMDWWLVGEERERSPEGLARWLAEIWACPFCDAWQVEVDYTTKEWTTDDDEVSAEALAVEHRGVCETLDLMAGLQVVPSPPATY